MTLTNNMDFLFGPLDRHNLIHENLICISVIFQSQPRFNPQSQATSWPASLSPSMLTIKAWRSGMRVKALTTRSPDTMSKEASVTDFPAHSRRRCRVRVEAAAILRPTMLHYSEKITNVTEVLSRLSDATPDFWSLFISIWRIEKVFILL